MLTAEQQAARAGKLTASRVACLVAGDTEKINRLYKQMIGEDIEEDLYDFWPARLGEATEQLQLDWYEQKHGAWITRRGEVVVHPTHPDFACTLDGWLDDVPAPVECKHVGGHETRETIVERYQPQMHWQMICTSTMQCALSIIEGASQPVVEFVPRDPLYSTELIKRGEWFMDCVRRRVRPFAVEPLPPPIDPSKVYDFTGSNMWAWAAAEWLANKDAAKTAEIAKAALKELVPADAKKCTGHGVRITRDRAGKLSLREDA